MQAPTNNAENIEVITSLKPTELKIVKAFLWFFKERIAGNHNLTFPSRTMLAAMADCSDSSVKLFIKKFENVLIYHNRRRDPKSKRCLSNLYEFNMEFFEWLVLFDAAGFFGRLLNSVKYALKKLKMKIWEMYLQNQDFLFDLLYKNPLMNNDFTHGFLSRLPSIKSYLLRILSPYKVLQGADSSNRKQDSASAPTDRRGFGKSNAILEGLPLSGHDKAKLMCMFGTYHLKKAREAFLYKHGDNANIQNPASFIFMTARNSSINLFKVK